MTPKKSESQNTYSFNSTLTLFQAFPSANVSLNIIMNKTNYINSSFKKRQIDKSSLIKSSF